MGITVQQDIALKAVASVSKRMFSIVGNAEKKKVCTFRTPKGRHLAIVLTNKSLTAVTEPVYSPTQDIPGEHKRRYAPNEPRNSNLNFDGSRLGVGDSIDWWVFQSLREFEDFCDWYASESPDAPTRSPSVASTDASNGVNIARPVLTPSAAGASSGSSLFSRFRPILEGSSPPNVRDERLRMNEDGRIRIYYAPFEYISPAARVVLVGITPGPTQMANANREARRALHAGFSEAEAIKAAKDTAAFSGEPMRGNLIRQLNHWGVQQWLGLQDGSELFSTSRELVQTTSLLRYPVFVDGDDYRGKPDMLKHPLLRDQLMRYFVEETKVLGKAIFFALGPEVQRVLDSLVKQGLLDGKRIVGGMLHPSGNCTYRINYLTGDRTGLVPHATNPAPYDQGRRWFQERYLRATP